MSRRRRVWVCGAVFAAGASGCSDSEAPTSAPVVSAEVPDAGGDTEDPPGEPTSVEPPEPSPLLSFACRDDAARVSSSPSDSEAPASLRQLERTVGVALSAQRLTEPAYAQTAAAQFNQVTPENEMKWDTIEPNPGEFNFGPADAVVAFAAENGMQVRGHTLVWHSQLPAWVEALTGADAVRAAMTSHIQGVIAHFREAFPGTVVGWDVVNEAMTAQGGMVSYRDSVFYRELGEGFIAEAFQIARAADPEAQLFYNDFGIEGMGGKATATFDMVSALVAASVPIDGIGLQMHTVSDDRGPGLGELEANIARYTQLGVRIDISEMDVSLCGIGNSSFALESQRFRYNRVVSACLASPACSSITVWGLADPHSWLNSNGCNTATVQPMPLVFDAAYARKPAWWGIYDALAGCRYD